MDDGAFGEAVHALMRELGWTHGALTPSLVHQALAQVRHLRKEAELSGERGAALKEALDGWSAWSEKPHDDERIMYLRRLVTP